MQTLTLGHVFTPHFQWPKTITHLPSIILTDEEDDSIATFASSRNYRDERVVINRAYFDYNFSSVPLNIALGRLSTNLGPPFEQYDQLPRQGTYLNLSYNMILDGVAFTYSLDEYLKKSQKLKLKLLYTPLGTIDQSSEFQNVTYLDKNGSEEDRSSYTDFFTFIVDFSDIEVFFAKKFEFITQYYSVKDALPPTSFFGGDALETLRTDYGVDDEALTFYTNFENLYESRFSLNHSTTFTKVDPHGDIYCDTAGFGAFPNCNGEPIGSGAGLNGAEKYGTGHLTQLLYDLENNETRLGFEYFSSDKTYITYNSFDEGAAPFNSTPGNARHFFVSHIPAKNMRLRLGYKHHRSRSLRGAESGFSTEQFTDVNRDFETFYFFTMVNF